MKQIELEPWMRSIFFAFRPEVEQQVQDTVLANIGSWSAIVKARRLNPGAKKPEIVRMCYVYVRDDADINEIVKQLSALPEIESAAVPAERHLV